MNFGKYTVDINRINSQDNLDLVEEKWSRDGIIEHPFGEAAYKLRSERTGCTTLERFYEGGVIGRHGGPAEIRYYPESAQILHEAFYRLGAKSNLGAPAFVEYHEDGEPHVVEWYFEGELHRDDGGAAIQVFDAHCRLPVLAEWYRFGILTRDDGPAIVKRDPDTGMILEEEWYQKGLLGRLDGGPAVIDRDQFTGKPVRLEWYEEGTKINRPQSNVSPNAFEIH